MPDYDDAYFTEQLDGQDMMSTADALDAEYMEITREMCDPSEFYGYSEFYDEELENLLPF